jgi:glutamine amidotransferase
MIAIINYGMGNLGSVQNALTFLGLDSEIVDDPEQLKTYDKAILPGVGAFGQAMQNLNAKGQPQAIKEYVAQGKPLLGICLGMQLLLESSCELGQYEGLGLIKGHVRSLKDKVKKLPIPHVGWNTMETGCPSKIFNNDPAIEPAFYFVHSFYCDVEDKNTVAGTAMYEIKIDVAVEKDNLFGCQFHPEKSQKHGLEILKKFGQL